MDNIYTTFKDHPVYKKLKASGPKRILSLEGDNENAGLKMNFLQAIEEVFIARYGNPNFVLSDYFDLVGGEGKQAVIATFIALGKSISSIKSFYEEQENTSLYASLLDHPDLINLTVGSNQFKTGLAILSSTSDSSDSILIDNHPSSENYESQYDLQLFSLLNAPSSNNLSMMLFNLATKEEGYGWRGSKDHLMMISIGNELNQPIPSFLHYCRYDLKMDQTKFEKDTIKIEEDFPDTFDFGVDESTTKPYSQEELKTLFSSVFQEEGKVYQKCKRVFARRTETVLKLPTITSDGIETINTALPGDYIVKNQTETAEQYILKRESFEKRYEEIGLSPDGLWKEYLPIGQVVGIQLTEDLLEKLKLEKHFNIMASWGQAQYIAIGDIMVKPINDEEFYRIGLKEFNQTYELKA